MIILKWNFDVKYVAKNRGCSPITPLTNNKKLLSAEIRRNISKPYFCWKPEIQKTVICKNEPIPAAKRWGSQLPHSHTSFENTHKALGKRG